MRNLRFTFLCTQDERRALDWLAAHYCRSKGDTIRELLRNAIQAIEKPGRRQRQMHAKRSATARAIEDQTE
jgi:hypothetical protein